ncbi:MAG: PEP-CTERM sorting domain-containing protein [Thiobacillus sp.]
MKLHRKVFGFTLSTVAVFVGNQAHATATLGGVVSLVGGSGTCNYSQLVPLNTQQDTFLLSGANGCLGGSSSVDLHGEAATGTIGLRATSSGNGLGSFQAAAQVYYSDHWLITPSAGLANGTYTIPVSLTLDGNISSGALNGFQFNRFLDYGMSVRDLYGGLAAPSLFSTYGSIATTGVFSQTFDGNVSFNYYGPGSGLPMTAEVTATLSLPGLNEGLVDFYNTAAISMQLPSGFSAKTSSGMALVFPPVPEPQTNAMMMAGLGLVAWRAHRQRALEVDNNKKSST